MKEKISSLKFYNFSHPLLNTEVLSLFGDKYERALSFSWEFTSDYETADVVLWDGVVTPRNTQQAERILSDVAKTKILLLIGESMTLFRGHSLVKSFSLEGIRVVELAGWNVLPEEILLAFESCYQKIKHV